MESIVQSIELFQKGGPVMYLILACSLLVVTIGVERFLYYRTAKTKDGDLLAQTKSAIEVRDWVRLESLCRQDDGAVSTLILNGGRRLQQENSCLESLLEGEAALQVGKLKNNLNHLESIVTIAPLLGLLGTVIGMINSFSVMNLKNGQPLAITGGVGEALVATASGLCVAILAMLVHSYFNHQLNRMIGEMEEACLFMLGQGR